jgi:hypothetical protein
MLTLLGQEKYQVVGFMWFLGAVWISIAIWLLFTSRLTLRQYLSFTAMIAFYEQQAKSLEQQIKAKEKEQVMLIKRREDVENRMRAW